jgi:hypothetical protein
MPRKLVLDVMEGRYFEDDLGSEPRRADRFSRRDPLITEVGGLLVVQGRAEARTKDLCSGGVGGVPRRCC